MRMKGKKPIFNYKDTYSLDHVLAPILKEGIQHFLDTKRRLKSDLWGIPSSILQELFPKDFSYNHSAKQLAEGDVEWERRLEYMIYAFDPSKEPNMDNYNFDLKLENSTIKHTGEQSEYQRFQEDSKQWAKKCELGREYFAKHFHDLWW